MIYKENIAQWLRGLMGPMGLIGPMGLMRPIRLMGLMGLIGLVGLLGACSSEEEPEVVQVVTPEVEEPVVETAITFSGHEEEEQLVTRSDASITRAGTPLSESATSFKVWGYKNMDYNEGTSVYSGEQTVFPCYTVNWYSNSAGTTTSNSSNWEYVMPSPEQTIKYWDWSAAAYRFFAATGWADPAPPTPPAVYVADKAYGAAGTYGPADAYATYNVSMLTNCSDDNDNGIEELEVIKANMNETPFFTRLWFSTGKLPEYADKQFGKPVVLEFLKPYARVRFIFKYVFPREAIQLTKVSFKPSDGSAIARKGTLTISYPLSGTAIKEWYDATGDTSKGALTDFTVDYDPENDAKTYSAPQTDEGWYIVVPNNHQGSYTLTVKINEIEKTAVVPADFMQWLPGYSYTYLFKVLDEGGVKIDLVETAITPWTNVNLPPHEVYNW